MAFKPPFGVGNPFDFGAELRHFRAAWANRYLKPVNVICLGDSITQGYWATDASKRWFEVFLYRLCQNAGQTPPVGYVPLDTSGLTSYTNRDWTKPAGNTQREHFEGPTLTAVALDATSPGPTGTANYTFPTPVDRIWVYGTSYTSFVQGLSIQIDATTAWSGTFVGASDKGSVCWDSGPLVRGTHKVTCTATGGLFPTIVEGCIGFDGNGPNVATAQGLITDANADTGQGLRIWNFSHNGYTTTSWTTTGSRPWTDCFNTVRPDLVCVLLGCNDDFTSMSLATYRTNIYSLISQINAANAALTPAENPPSFVFIGMYGTGADHNQIPPYNEVTKSICAELGLAYVDWYALAGFVGQATSDIYGLTSALDSPTDRKHPSDIGHQLLGDNLAAIVTNTIGPTGQIPRQPSRKITASGRSVADGVLNGTTTVTSATAAFVAGTYPAGDVGRVLTGIGIPIGATIVTRTSATAVVISSAATLSGTGVTLEITDPITNPQYLTDNVFIVDTTTVSQPIGLPTPVGQSDQEFSFKKIDASSNKAILYTPTGTAIDGGREYDLATQFQTITVKSDGVNWYCMQPYRTDTGTLLDTGGETNMSRNAIANITTTATSGAILLTPFIAARSEAITKMRVRVGGTIAATITTIKLGVYQVDKNGNLTLLAITANTTGMTGTANAAGTLTSLTSTFNKIAGRLYCTAFIFVGTTAPTLWGGGGLTSTSTATVNPFDLMPYSGALRRTGQTDLVAAITKANLVIATATQAPYVEMLP